MPEENPPNDSPPPSDPLQTGTPADAMPGPGPVVEAHPGAPAPAMASKPDAMPSPQEIPGMETPLPPPQFTETEMPASEPRPPSPPTLQPAGFIRRGLAFAIDLVIIYVLFGILIVAGVLGAVGASAGRMALTHLAASPFFPTLMGMWFFLFVGYFTFFHSHGGQTPAKMIIRIKVVTLEGGALSFLQSLLRAFGYFASSAFLMVGFLLAIIGPQKRGLHDFLTRSQVVLV